MDESEQRLTALVAMARNESLLILRLIMKLGVALLVVEVLTWIVASAPAPQPPALTLVEKSPVNASPSHAAQAPTSAGVSDTR